MNKQIWLNLAVKDINATAQFFNAIGFKEVERHKDNPSMRGFMADGTDMVVMMFTEDLMKGFLHGEVSDTSKGNEVLINLGLNSVEEVNELYQKVKTAGGIIFNDSEPGWTDGWMYAFGFSDPSGHKWVPIFMDPSKMSQA